MLQRGLTQLFVHPHLGCKSHADLLADYSAAIPCRAASSEFIQAGNQYNSVELTHHYRLALL